MENASKALLIAAAVLIVVLLVAFGMRIFNQSQNAGDAGETATTIQTGISSATDKLSSAISGGEKKLTMDELYKELKVETYKTFLDWDTAFEHGKSINKKTYNTVDGEIYVKSGLGQGVAPYKKGECYYFSIYSNENGEILISMLIDSTKVEE